MNWSSLVGSSIPFAIAEHFRREQKPLLVLVRAGVVADNLKSDLEFFLGSDAPFTAGCLVERFKVYACGGGLHGSRRTHLTTFAIGLL